MSRILDILKLLIVKRYMNPTICLFNDRRHRKYRDTKEHALYFIRSQDKVENFCACKFELSVNVHYFPGGSQDINDVVVFNYVNLNDNLWQ